MLLHRTIGGPALRTRDALHPASAVLVRNHLTAFVVDDHRLAGAGLVVETPGRA